MTTDEIRQKFLTYFKSNAHQIVSSDSLIPSSDPSLLFTSAGMVQFKKNFLGQTSLEFRRAASCQKCLRTSDIERVGLTARHLTFFEMLGNFSFGDYFKKEAIAWGWEFLTQECSLKPDRLYASIYKEDEEARQIWKKVLPESRIVPLGEESNFWNMGPTGPCGPCSEILVDRGESFSQDHACPGPGCDCDRYLEVWNLVFTQFDRTADGKLRPLPQKNIDTGMGLERLSSVIQGLSSAFETDLFEGLNHTIRNFWADGAADKKSERIIADHMRSCAFLICDGVLPSNEGRGYILRRLLRRAFRQGWVHGKKEPFLHLLVKEIVHTMEKTYPDLSERKKNIETIIAAEEKNFLSTIESGTQVLEEAIRQHTSKTVKKGVLGDLTLPGEKVFMIYDTYGLDKEIQKEMVRDWGGELKFSEEEYTKSKDEAVTRARKGWKGSGEKDVSLYSNLHKRVGNIPFRGYETLSAQAKILSILQGKERKEVEEIKENEEGELVLSETPFYAESGGQAGDQGTIGSASKSETAAAEVLDTQKPIEGLIVHTIRVRKGKLRIGQEVTASVNEESRAHTMRHHTATHLLHAALRKILGSHVTQAGSLVSPEKLRFDFTFSRSLTPEETQKVEIEVNSKILSNISRKRSEESLDDARKEGALAFFGDKYGSKVFVVRYGDASTEVCGGTHCHSTGEIGFFKITAESSVGSNLRRIEAVAGEKALIYTQTQEKVAQSLSEKLKCSFSEAPEKVDRLTQKLNDLEKDLSQIKKRGH
ncbi:MAG: alanine--tRNA ligase, partial [Elusimicrobia bacterium]|nr:alanine--tRNA ligase [Elusimicrobiota bacterium]